MKKKSKEKVFIIQKRVLAPTAAAALRKEKKVDADDVFMERKGGNKSRDLPPLIGFSVERNEEEDGDDE